ncbi:phage putative head morphogenesis protein, SPP1 gp7 family [Luteibacter sp. UNC138MFCol5.1]|nr:phage putative head morphogenesis protein, SPP1 gp7 family [Luteibacter sp. UNC138MFCol5.1]
MLRAEPALTRDAPADGGGTFGISFAEAVERSLTAASRRFGGIDQWASRVAAAAAGRVDKQTTGTIVSSVRSAFGIDIGPMMAMSDVRATINLAKAANVQLIKSVQSTYFDRIGSAVLSGVTQGRRASDLADEIQRITDVTESRAKFIARDQTAKMNSAITKARHVELGLTEYTWQTSGDERVRASHAEHDGKVYRWDDPPKETGHPGEDFNCRCVAIPYVKIEDDE